VRKEEALGLISKLGVDELQKDNTYSKNPHITYSKNPHIRTPFFRVQADCVLI